MQANVLKCQKSNSEFRPARFLNRAQSLQLWRNIFVATDCSERVETVKIDSILDNCRKEYSAILSWLSVINTRDSSNYFRRFIILPKFSLILNIFVL